MSRKVGKEKSSAKCTMTGVLVQWLAYLFNIKDIRHYNILNRD